MPWPLEEGISFEFEETSLDAFLAFVGRFPLFKNPSKFDSLVVSRSFKGTVVSVRFLSASMGAERQLLSSPQLESHVVEQTDLDPAIFVTKDEFESKNAPNFFSGDLTVGDGFFRLFK
jgi:hypothetical protein